LLWNIKDLCKQIFIKGGSSLPTKEKLNKTFNIIIERMIATGSAPTYADLADELGITRQEGRKVLRKIINGFSFPGWFQPNSDEIASFAPFNNIPSPYRLTIDGKQKWFGQ